MNAFLDAWHRYWHDEETDRGRMVALRFILYGLLAVDVWSITLEHASRYGAGGFNVAQIGILDAILPVPTPAVIAAGWMLCGYFCLRAAFGVAIRQSMIGAAVCYFGIYLWSQVDSYQHHYFVGLLLTIACFIPEQVWQGRPPADLDDEARERWHTVKHWGVRLIYVQIALMYFWTGVTKADPTWLSGATMDSLTGVPEIRTMMAEFEQARGWSRGSSYAVAAHAVMVGELLAPIFFLVPRLRLIGLFVVPWFHIGVEILEFDIELFSYYMIGLDLILLLPDRGWAFIRNALAGLGPLADRLLDARPTESTPRMIIALVTAAITGWLCSTITVEGADTLAILIGGATLLALWPSPLLAPRAPVYAAVVQVGCIAAMMFCVTYFESLYDMYRLWGGDLRRRGNLELAAEKYAIANAHMEGLPARRYQQAQIYDRLGRRDEAVPLYEESMKVHAAQVDRLITASHKDPNDIDLLVELGQDQLRLTDRCQAVAKVRRRTGGDVEEAERCARQALLGAEETADKARALKPRDRGARRLINQVRREKNGR